jgi:hypothetical protein
VALRAYHGIPTLDFAAPKPNDLANKTIAYLVCKTIHPHSLFVARYNTTLSRSRLGRLRLFHFLIRLDSPPPRQLATSHPCMCPYFRAVRSRLVQTQPEVRLAGPGTPVFEARGFFTVLYLPTALHRSVLFSSVSLFVR